MRASPIRSDSTAPDGPRSGSRRARGDTASRAARKGWSRWSSTPKSCCRAPHHSRQRQAAPSRAMHGPRHGTGRGCSRLRCSGFARSGFSGGSWGCGRNRVTPYLSIMTLGRVGEKKLGLWGRLKRVMLTDVGALVRGLKAADLEQIEQLLIEADFGVPATMELVDALEQGV